MEDQTEEVGIRVFDGLWSEKVVLHEFDPSLMLLSQSILCILDLFRRKVLNDEFTD